MSRNSTLQIFISCCIIMLSSCGGDSQDATVNKSSTQKEDRKEEESIDGVYTGSQNISGLELVAKLTISGKRWSATSQFGYDSPEFQNGIVDGKDLYDDSGSIKIGYVSGSSASIDGYPSMRK